MEYSPEQNSALSVASDWIHRDYSERNSVLYIAGFAGVGKTTIAKEIAAQCPGEVLFAAYTGKAAYVMRQKGCVGTSTIHSLIYRPAGESRSDALRKIETEIIRIGSEPGEDPDDNTRIAKRLKQLEEQRDFLLINEKRKPMFVLNSESALQDASLLIIDECSMVDEQMGQDLLSFKKKILVLGDPMQLPPVGSGGFFTKRPHDILLTEVHRQAKESGILRLATDVRERGTYSRDVGAYGADCVIGSRKNIPDFQKIVLDADQMLVGMNATRHINNARFRELTGKAGHHLPIAGDKIVCLRNNHKMGLLNGSLWRVHESEESDHEVIDMTISSEEDGGVGVQCSSWTHHFMGQEDNLKLKRWAVRDHEEFDYGYALTVHKAQGSQWDDVVLFDESGVFKSHRLRWLYTGITRAAKRLWLVR